MTRVTLPFPPGSLQNISADLDFSQFVHGDPIDTLADTEFWVPPYSKPIDYANALARMPKLKVLQTQSAGVDNVIDLIDPAVTLCSARGVHDAATSELGVALILASLRNLPGFVRAQDRGQWTQDLSLPSLADRRVLIVGYGSIGAALEKRLAGFEVDIVRVARTARDGIHGFDELPALLPAAEVVVLLTPLTAQTHHLADARFLARMADGALLVNLGRGPLVDTDALIAELSSGRLNAALDVTDPEPLTDHHPLWSAPNLLITPHVGGGTTAMQPRLEKLLAQQLENFVAGHTLHNVIDH